MNINLMRGVDYYAGITICFLLTIIHKITNFKNPKKPIKNILFIQLAEMGSMVLSYSSIKKTKKLYPDANIFFLTFKKNRYCIEALNIIDKKNIITIREDSFFNLTSDTIKTITRFRKIKIDTSIDLELFSRFSNIISYLSGASKRIGFSNYYTEGLYRGDLLTHKVHYNTHQHISLNFLALIHSIKYPEKSDYLLKEKIYEKEIILPKIKITEKAKENLWNRLKKYNSNINPKNKLIVINPFAGELLPIRSWPLSYYIELIKKLLKNKNNYIIITGGNDTKNWQNKILNEIKDNRIIPLAGKTTFSDIINLYNISDVLITNDSGPVHFASLTPLKTFAFFGPGGLTYKSLSKNTKTFYTNYSCSPCLTDFNHGQTSCKNPKCLKAIKVEEVYKEVSKYLETKK